MNFGFGFKQIEWNPLLVIGYQYEIFKPLIWANWALTKLGAKVEAFVIWKKETKYYWPTTQSFKIVLAIHTWLKLWNMHDNKPNWESVTTVQSFKTTIVTETWQGKGKKDMVDTHLKCTYFCLFLIQQPCAHATNVQICDLSSM